MRIKILLVYISPAQLELVYNTTCKNHVQHMVKKFSTCYSTPAVKEIGALLRYNSGAVNLARVKNTANQW